MKRPHDISVWTWACVLLATLKAVGGIVSYTIIPTELIASAATPFPTWLFLLVEIVFLLVAGLLLVGGGSDLRALLLGIVFLLSSSSFSDYPLTRLSSMVAPSLSQSVFIILRLHANAFIPYFLWLFVREFPKGRVYGWMGQLLKSAGLVCLVVGSLLFVIDAGVLIGNNASGSVSELSFLQGLRPGPWRVFYWAVLFGLSLPAFGFMIWKSRVARTDERRRVGLFISGIVVGSLPIMLTVFLEGLVPPFRSFMNQNRLASGYVLYPLLISVPITTAYSVLVHHVLEVQLIIRRAIQYALARYTLMAAAATPAFLLIIDIYQRREHTLASLFSSFAPVWLLGATVFLVATLQGRSVVFDLLDRKFFREHYDARQIMAMLVEKCRAVRNKMQMTAVLITEIDRALHLDTLAVLMPHAPVANLTSPNQSARPLSTSSSLAGHIVGSREPLDVDLSNATSPLRQLPLDERQWLADGAFRLLVPMIASNGTLLAIIALGEKKSELPFSKEDRLLLTAIADSAALTLELQIRKEQGSIPARTDVTPDQDGMECPGCGAMHASTASLCDSCGERLEVASVPHVLLGKFRFEKRIGEGAMGVVYRALDLVLDRVVAIKTLPRASPEYSFRLRREARAMAAMGHPNLALIFGAETWHGLPLLVFEFLNGGTLAQRLLSKPLSPPEAIDLGIMLADVLELVHSRGILHRDIKPSNIGYKTAEGVPKLMDFGLAHLLHETQREERIGKQVAGKASLLSTRSLMDTVSHSRSGYVIGTPLYLSPEAVNSEPADTSFDLWATMIVLYESMAGKNPMESGKLSHTLSLISQADVPDIRTLRPECPEPVALFFKNALAKNVRRRPSGAKELKIQLERLKDSLAPRL